MNTIRLICTAFGNGMDISERLSNGGRMILVLMAFVFGVIFTIYLSQSIISFIINKAQSRAKVSKDQKPEKAIPVKNEVPEETVTEASENDTDDVTVAVITAALTAYLASTSEDGKVLPFRVVSFKRKNSGKPWNS